MRERNCNASTNTTVHSRISQTAGHTTLVAQRFWCRSARAAARSTPRGRGGINKTRHNVVRGALGARYTPIYRTYRRILIKR